MERKTDFERALAPPSGRHLVINTFGLAILMCRGVQVRTDQPTDYPIGTDGFEYNIRVNTSRTIDIQFRDNVGTTINVEMGENTVTQIRVTPEGLHVGPTYYLAGDQLTQRFVMTEPNYNRSTFRLKLLNSQMIRRVDLRYLNHSWITILIHGNRVISATLNGSDLVDSLQQIGEAILEQGSSAQRQGVMPTRNFGLTARDSRLGYRTPNNPRTNQNTGNVPCYSTAVQTENEPNRPTITQTENVPNRPTIAQTESVPNRPSNIPNLRPLSDLPPQLQNYAINRAQFNAQIASTNEKRNVRTKQDTMSSVSYDWKEQFRNPSRKRWDSSSSSSNEM